jgi:elongation factor Ts
VRDAPVDRPPERRGTGRGAIVEENETMAQITAALVKELREKTGAGMMDCKAALTETDGEVEAAVDWLRKKGLSAAAKKAGRIAAEGLVGLATDDRAGALVEINSETDFVARNETFQEHVREIATLALAAGGDLNKLRAAAYPGAGRTVEDEITHLVATIGENISLRRCVALTTSDGLIASYMHSASAPNLGRIGVIVALEGAPPSDPLSELGHQLAMHIAAANPQAVSPADLDATVVERERAVLAEQAKASGKPDNIIEKMVEGRLRKFYQDVVLLEQTWVIDGETKVAKVIEAAGKDSGAAVRVGGFVRYALGEGIERKDEDFAAEVAAQLGS